MTTVLPVRSAKNVYDVVIGQNVLERCGTALRERGVRPDEKLFIVTDEQVQKLGYANTVRASCEAQGFAVSTAVIRPGDASKTLDTARQLYETMVTAGVRRSGVVLAVGGGVVGDLAGFVAATYQRGVRFAQVPTTLLAHDSSLGGKVGVNLPQGKNLVGAFHPPVAVLFDTGVLASLPAVEWQGGMAEVIKHGIIGDATLFAELSRQPLAACPSPERLESLLAQACAVKIAIVEEDERESGKRMLLNLGHTVGHAVEQASHYELNHGYSVAIGTSVELEIAVARQWLGESQRDRIRAVFAAHGLPLRPPAYDLEEIFDLLGHDKKHGSQGWTFALARGVGTVDIARDVTPDEVRAAWAKTAALA